MIRVSFIIIIWRESDKSWTRLVGGDGENAKDGFEFKNSFSNNSPKKNPKKSNFE